MTRAYLAVIACALLVIAIGGTSAAEVPPGVATLVEGPVAARGIDALAPDLTPHWFSRYRIGDSVVGVYLLDAPLDAAASWPASSCTARRVSVRDGAWYYAHPTGWSLLVVADPDAPVCAFVDRFVARYLFFLGVEGRGAASAPPLPAVVDLR